MRIAISSTGSTLDAEVDPRFGRCQYFVIVDPETMEMESMQNTNSMASGGAGISTGQVIVSKGVDAVLTGNCGPNAYQVLSAAGIKVITGVSGKIKDAIEKYKAGAFKASGQANVVDHFGAGGGMGRGRGMGKGMGRGMGGVMGAGTGPVERTAAESDNPEQEIDELNAQSKALAQQIADIQRRIEELDKKRR
jgi:predicted Fe-Mo cluster-binding NifX family protein